MISDQSADKFEQSIIARYFAILRASQSQLITREGYCTWRYAKERQGPLFQVIFLLSA